VFQIIEPESAPGTVEMPRRRLSLQVPKSYNTLGVSGDDISAQFVSREKIKLRENKQSLEEEQTIAAYLFTDKLRRKIARWQNSSSRVKT
jgi:hypothetical protein